MTDTTVPLSGLPGDPASRQVDYSIAHLTHVRRRHYGRWAAAALILTAFGLLVRAFAEGQIAWAVVGQFFTAPAILSGLVYTIVMTFCAMTLGIVLGVLFAAVFASLRHRLPGRADAARAGVLAAVGFALSGLLPAMVVPANPPGVGDESTVGTRTAIYGGVLLCGILVAVATWLVIARLRAREVSTATTAVAATAVAAVLLAGTVLVLPESPDAVPSDVSATLLWRFRAASLGQLLVLWAGIGLTGGFLLDRITRRDA